MEKQLAPKPAKHEIEYDIEACGKEYKNEVQALVLKNHLPQAPFLMKFPEFEVKITDLAVDKDLFKVFVEVKKGDKIVQLESPFCFHCPPIHAWNGTYRDDEPEKKNYEVHYKGAFEELMVGKLEELKII